MSTGGKSTPLPHKSGRNSCAQESSAVGEGWLNFVGRWVRPRSRKRVSDKSVVLCVRRCLHAAEEVGEVRASFTAVGELPLKNGQRLLGVGRQREGVLRGRGLEGFATFEEVFLRVGADLGAGAGADDFFDLLPVAAIELESCVRRCVPSRKWECSCLVHRPFEVAFPCVGCSIFQIFSHNPNFKIILGERLTLDGCFLNLIFVYWKGMGRNKPCNSLKRAFEKECWRDFALIIDG